MKKAPRSPQTIPSIIAAGKSNIEFCPYWPPLPKVMTPPPVIDNGAPSCIVVKIDRVNTATVVAKKH